MKANCFRETLLGACQLVSAAIPAKSIKPILQNFKASVSEGRFTLIATDMDVGIRLDVESINIEEEGDAILPAAKLIAILREARDKWLTLTVDANACVVSGEKVEFEMPSEDPAPFPDFPGFTEDRYHEISAGTLRQMISHTLFAASSPEEQARMAGVLWDLDGSKITLVATDGRRLAMSEGIATVTGGHTTKGQMPVVPTKAMKLLERNLNEGSDAVIRVLLRANEVLFRTERAVIYARLVEGRFPDYRAVMPKKAPVTIGLKVMEFQAAVRQAAIMAESETRRVSFKFDAGKLTLLAQGSMSGRSRIEMALDDYDGKPIEINFNPDYITDMLKVLPAEAALSVELIDGASPAVFRCADNYTYLVMPLT